MNKVKKLSVVSLTLAISLILSYIETLVPFSVGVPVKIGLANIAIMFALYKIGCKEAIIISILRVIIVSVLFTNVITFYYSIGGAILSLLMMIIVKKLDLFNIYVTCVIGSLSHNIGQIIVAFILLDNSLVFYYLPYLLLFGLISGLFIGIFSAIIIKRVNI